MALPFDVLDGKGHLTDRQKEDEIINVTLSKFDYEVMRDMIEKQKSLNWFGKYVKTVILIAAGGLLTFLMVGEQLKKYFFGG